jgi:hypothetical protein
MYGKPKNVWEVISHEVGHTLGLEHDGNSTARRYHGQGDWAPIMGEAEAFCAAVPVTVPLRTVTTLYKGAAIRL